MLRHCLEGVLKNILPSHITYEISKHMHHMFQTILLWLAGATLLLSFLHELLEGTWSYLDHWTIWVTINLGKSVWTPAKFSVPPGSAFGPLLCILIWSRLFLLLQPKFLIMLIMSSCIYVPPSDTCVFKMQAILRKVQIHIGSDLTHTRQSLCGWTQN